MNIELDSYDWKDTEDINIKQPIFNTYNDLKQFVNKRLYLEVQNPDRAYQGFDKEYFFGGKLYIGWAIFHNGTTISPEFCDPVLLFQSKYNMSVNDADYLIEYTDNCYFFFLFEPPGEWVLNRDTYSGAFKKKYIFKNL